MQTMTLDQFRAAFQAGGLRSVRVAAEGGLFFVVAEPRSGERIKLATTRGKTARGFRDPGKAIAVLHNLGARQVEVDTSEWSPEQAASEGRRRPDTAARQRRAHQAAAYDAWFRAEVGDALREADDPNTVWISNEDVERESAERRARWIAQAARTE
jgi:hypothetical protein